LAASFRREAKYEPTGRAKRRIHGVPRKELPNAVRAMMLNYGVFNQAKFYASIEVVLFRFF